MEQPPPHYNEFLTGEFTDQMQNPVEVLINSGKCNNRLFRRFHWQIIGIIAGELLIRKIFFTNFVCADHIADARLRACRRVSTHFGSVYSTLFLGL